MLPLPLFRLLFFDADIADSPLMPFPLSPPHCHISLTFACLALSFFASRLLSLMLPAAAIIFYIDDMPYCFVVDATPFRPLPLSIFAFLYSDARHDERWR